MRRAAWPALVLVGLTAARAASPGDDPTEYALGIDFDNDVLPVLTRAGCNSGECHGAALGQGGFKLSLLGYDADADWAAIARALRGRRIETIEPDESLLLRKATRRMPHEGGRRLRADDQGYTVLRDWIADGAPRRTDERRPVALRIDGEEQLRTIATYDDGSWRDVTDWTLFSSNDDSMVEVDEQGRVDRWRSGETSIVARFGGLIAVERLTEPFGEASGVLPAAGSIDTHVGRRLERLGLDAPAACDDATFLRRASLDLVGRLPSVEQVLAFEADPDRAALVERLTSSSDFAVYWGYRMSELLPDRPGVSAWLARELAEDRPWDEVVSETLLAVGQHPATALFASNDPKLMVERAAESFLGQSIRCAQCHNHPFSSFSRADYFGLASFFARVRMQDGQVELARRGELRIPDTPHDVSPAFPGGDLAVFAEGEDRRAALAAWLVDQPDFARSFVNRVWALLLGEGLVEPLDDLRPSNPGVDPELLEALASRFVAEGFSLRTLVAEISRSESYQRLKRSRPMSAAVLYDALADATGVPDVQRAVQEPTLDSQLLEVSGRGERFEGSLAQALYLLDSPELEAKLRAMPRFELETLYLRLLGRRPTPIEQAIEPDSREAYEDLVWAILNSTEFLHVR
jgi:hypothetical protein